MFLTSLTLLHLKTPTSSLPENTNKHAPPPSPPPTFFFFEKEVVCGGGGGGLQISTVKVKNIGSPLSLHYREQL